MPTLTPAVDVGACALTDTGYGHTYGPCVLIALRLHLGRPCSQLHCMHAWLHACMCGSLPPTWHIAGASRNQLHALTGGLPRIRAFWSRPCTHTVARTWRTEGDESLTDLAVMTSLVIGDSHVPSGASFGPLEVEAPEGASGAAEEAAPASGVAVGCAEAAARLAALLPRFPIDVTPRLWLVRQLVQQAC